MFNCVCFIALALCVHAENRGGDRVGDPENNNGNY